MKYLITGITGQDGLHLTSKILSSASKDSVLGITRTIPNKSFFKNLEYLKKGAKVVLHKVSNPEKFGVATVKGKKILSIKEKPKKF